MQPKTFFSAASEFKTLVGQPASCWWYTLDQILERKCFLWSLLSPSPALLTSLTVVLRVVVSKHLFVKWQQQWLYRKHVSRQKIPAHMEGPS